MQFPRFFPRIFHPASYQGKREPGNYFEGWYFKLVDKKGDHIWSVIPGVSYSSDRHSFIQLIHAGSGTTHYFRYPVEVFSFRKNRTEFAVGHNEFSDKGMLLKLEKEDFTLEGSITFSGISPFPQKILSPGIMGWYSFVPFMECYHGVVSMQHEINGYMLADSRLIRLDGGKGYIEKDWGRSMPSDWIWIQSNHFESDWGASFMFSVARIPWLKGFFPGFISFLRAGDKVYRFATYNGSRIQQLEINDSEVSMQVQHRELILEFRVNRKAGGALKAPRHGMMDREIEESIVSVVEVTLRDKTGPILFRDRGSYAGLEIVGDISAYLETGSAS